MSSAFTPRTVDEIRAHFTTLANGQPIHATDFAAQLDASDPFQRFRSQFTIPRSVPGDAASGDCIYLCGNSLGLQPLRAQAYVSEEMAKWAARGVEGHFTGDRPWVSIDEPSLPHVAAIVGAADIAEVGVMNSLSVNLHLLLTSFYRPTKGRYKLLIEEAAFCSDHHIVRSQIQLHGFDIDDALIQVKVRDGETFIRTEDIVSVINDNRDSLALVLLPGIQFYTGQLFNISAITQAAHSVGAIAGFDLAHAVGNVPLRLHEWGVDFAAWCSYKYLNSGPGSIAGLFLHRNHHGIERPRLSGWWGQTPAQRFKMLPTHQSVVGAQAYQLSNPPVLPTVCLQASVETFTGAGGVEKLREKSLLLTGYLQLLLEPLFEKLKIVLLTPTKLEERGCQLSLLLPIPIKGLIHRMINSGIICDGREPNVIRIAPTPLYNTFSDVQQFVGKFEQLFVEEQQALANGTASSNDGNHY